MFTRVGGIRAFEQQRPFRRAVADGFALARVDGAAKEGDFDAHVAAHGIKSERVKATQKRFGVGAEMLVKTTLVAVAEKHAPSVVAPRETMAALEQRLFHGDGFAHALQIGRAVFKIKRFDRVGFARPEPHVPLATTIAALRTRESNAVGWVEGGHGGEP